jgi:hypothetical protein
MHFWRKSYFETLKEVEAEALTQPEWADYALFCQEYEKGLRPQALKTLERFIFTIERSTFEERRCFVSWLLGRVDGREGRHMLVPQPLHIRVIEPTLLEWTLVEPKRSEPHRWLGGYDNLKHAVELEPNDKIARKKLLAIILGKVGMSTHELPNGYLGSVQDDLAALREAEELLTGFSDHKDRDRFAADIAEERERIQKYLSGGC